MYIWGVGKRVDTDNFTDKCNVRVMGGSGGEHAASVLVIIFWFWPLYPTCGDVRNSNDVNHQKTKGWAKDRGDGRFEFDSLSTCTFYFPLN